MAADNQKSASITFLDTSAPPAGRPTTGQGVPGSVRKVTDYVTTTAAASIGSIYRLVRIPSSVTVKNVVLENEAQAAGAGDVGLYYSDSTTDGTQVALQGTALDVDFFGTAVSVATAQRISVINESGTNPVSKRNQPIWQAAGLSVDPGGYFDVAVTLTTAITTGAAGILLDVEFND